MAKEFALCSECIIRLFFVVCLSNCGLTTCHSEVTNYQYCVFFKASRRGLKESPNKLLTVRVCSKLSSVKSSAQTRKCFDSLLSFESWVNLKVLANFGFWVVRRQPMVCAVNCHTKHSGFPLKFTVNLKPNSFKFPTFLELTNSDVISLFPTIFPTTLRLWRLENSDINIPISQECFVQFVWNFGIYLFYT